MLRLKCFRLIKKYVPVIILSSLLGFLAYYYTTGALKNIVERSLVETAEQGAIAIENDIKRYMDSLRIIARTRDIQDPSVAIEKKTESARSFLDGNEMLELAYIEKDGDRYSTDGSRTNAGNLEYFKKAVSGVESINDPIYSPIYDTDILIFAVPVYHQDKVEGVLTASYPSVMLIRMVEKIQFGQSGYGFIINAEGSVIAHIDKSLINMNAILESTVIEELNSLAELEKNMISGKTGAGEYRFNNDDKYMGYTKITGIPWYLAVTAPKYEVYGGAGNVIFLFVSGTIAFVLIIFVINAYLGFLKRRVFAHQNTIRAAIDTASIMTFVLNIHGMIIDFNKNAEEKLNLNRKQIIDKISIYNLIVEKHREKLKKKINQAGTENRNFELIFLTKQKPEHMICNLHPHESMDDCYELVGIDITERAVKELELKEKHEELSSVYEELAASEEELKDQLNELIQQKILLQEKDERHNLIVEASNIGIWDWDLAANKFYCSDKWYQIFECDKNERMDIHKLLDMNILPEDTDRLQASYKNHIDNKTSHYFCEYRIRTAKGKIKWISAIGKGLWDSDGKLVRMAGSHTDITSQKDAEEKITRLAYYDTLTGLPNRSRLVERFISIQSALFKKIALVYMDLDNFKLVNDSYGHMIGDRILVEVANRLTSLSKPNMLISRLGGDEYAILIWEYKEEEDLTSFVEDLMRHVETSIKVNEFNISLSTSVGIAIYPDDALNFDELLKNADTAMYKAKEKRNKYVFYHKEMNESILERLTLRNCLKGALDNNEFMIYYQPQYRVRDNRIMGFEALLRWNNDSLGMVSPAKFIPIAEESKLIIPIGEWILRKSIAFLKDLNEMGGSQLMMSVNISVIQLMQRDFTEKVLNILEEYEISSEFLELEITESVLMESIDSVMHNIILLRKAGVKIALDDFGTGYSSLNYLTKLPINTLKIDKSFIDNIGHVKEKSLLISSIVDIGRKLGLSIVAEGVEIKEQYDYLVRRRCDRVQGYLFSKPLPEKEVIKFLKDDLARNPLSDKNLLNA